MLPECPPGLRQQQHLLADHLRNPADAPAPAGIEDRRLDIYRELFFNNICNLLAGMFPVIRSLYSETDWRALVRSFYASHRCETPYFPSLGEELVAWLQGGPACTVQKPFLAELAHFEWVELALSIARDNPVEADLVSDGDVMTGYPVISPLCWPLCYRFPVNRISPANQPEEVPLTPTCLLVYRDPDNYSHVVESNPASIRLMELLQKNHMDRSSMVFTGEQALAALAIELQHPDPHTVLAFGKEILLTWQHQGIITGIATPH